MKKKTIYVIKTVIKFILPALVGWIEGDTHAVADAIASVLLFLF